MPDVGAGAPDGEPEMSMLEVEEAASDEAHPRHAEAKRILDDTVIPFLENFHRSTLPTMRGGRSKPAGSDSAAPGFLDRPRQELQRHVEEAQRHVEAMIQEQQDEKAAEQAQREKDRAEGRRQHRVMLGWTIASFGIALFAAAIAVVALFVSGG